MERISEYDNQTMQNEKLVIFINETKVDQVMEKRENSSLQIEINKALGVKGETNEDKTKCIWEQLQMQ
jgi:hypothetical protein